MSRRVLSSSSSGSGCLTPIHFGLIDDLDLEVAELHVNLVEIIRGDDILGQRVVNVVVSEVALLLGEANQFLDLLGQLNAGLAFHLTDGLQLSFAFRGGWWGGRLSVR